MAMPSMSCSSAMRAYQPAMPKWFESRTHPNAEPACRALSMTVLMARALTGAPRAPRASITTEEGVSFSTTTSARGSMRPVSSPST